MPKFIRYFIALLALLAASAAGVEVYGGVPASFDVTPIAVPPGTRTLVVLFHGSGGRDEPTLIALEKRFDEMARDQPDTAVIRYIWSPHSDTRLRANVNGTRIGDALGREVAGVGGIELIHLVSHSAGAYPLDAFCRAYREAASRPAQIALTYLDPIGFAGAFNPGWGAREYGRCGDYAEAVINTDDPVPATNEPLEHAWNLDVTAAAGRYGGAQDGHRWPVQYYLDHLTAEDLTAATREHASRPRGAVEKP